MTREQVETSYGRVTDRKPVRWGAVVVSFLLAVSGLAAGAATAGAAAASPITITALQFVTYVNAAGAAVNVGLPDGSAAFRYTLTNTGQAIVKVAEVVDSSHPQMTSDCSGELAGGGTRTCTAKYPLSVSILDAGLITVTPTVKATTADGAELTDVSATELQRQIAAKPGIKVDLTVSIADTRATAGKVDVGEEITYKMKVTNTGNVTLNSVTPTLTVNSASQTVTCNPNVTALDAGASMTCTFTKELEAADISGTMINVAKANGTPVRTGETTMKPGSDRVEVLMTGTASIRIAKTVTLVDSGRVDAGDLIKYTYKVTNGPDVPVVGVVVTDPIAVTKGNTEGKIPCEATTLGGGEWTTCTKTFVLTQAQVDAGFDVGPDAGEATVKATPTGRAELTSTVTTRKPLAASPLLAIKRREKANTAVVAPAGRADAGDEVTFMFTVVNTGNVTLTNVVLTAPDGGRVACSPTALAPKATATCPKVVVLTQEQVGAGALGAATATASTPRNGSVSGTDRGRTSLGGIASVMVDKTATVRDAVAAPAGRVDAGDVVVYSYTVKNSGNLTLTNVALVDTLRGPVRCPKTMLKPGESMKCSNVFVKLLQVHVDAAMLSSAAKATANPPRRSSVTGSDLEKTTLAAAPAVVLDKVWNAFARKVKPGDRVFYSFRATNLGNVTLTDVSVSYPDVAKVSCPKKALAPKASTTCTAVYRVTPADIEAGLISNTVTVAVKAPDGKTVTAEGAVSFSVAVGRQWGKDRYSTAAQISEETFSPGVKAVYIATGVNFPDALAGSAASGGNGPILLVSKDSIPEATLAELKRLKPKKIIVLGGTGVVSQTVEAILRKHGTTTRQSGRDRYSTAAAISARHFDSGAPVAYVATGEDYPDALTGGPAAAKLGGPILLTLKDKLPAATVLELKRLRPKRIVVLGGSGVVSKAVETALKSLSSGEVTRLGGADRYSTGAAISKAAFKPGVPVVYIATGVNFPDALAGGAAGALEDGPVLLVAGATIPKATRDELTRLKPQHIIVLGGTAAVPQSVRQALDAYIP